MAAPVIAAGAGSSSGTTMARGAVRPRIVSVPGRLAPFTDLFDDAEN